MLSVNSGRQLCKMFFSLQVVFLSVVIVESSASNGSQNGNMTPSYVLILLLLPGFILKYHAYQNIFLFHLTCDVVVLRLHEVQWCGLQRGTTELLLGSDLSELDQHHQRL